jgi:hypothetical protein
MNRERSRRGQSLVETALILAAFMALLFGMVSVGGLLFERQTLTARTQEAARWGATHVYNAAAIRSMVLYGSSQREAGVLPYLGLSERDIVVEDPGCPGPDCRVTVAVPQHAVSSVEPIECDGATCDGPARP